MSVQPRSRHLGPSLTARIGREEDCFWPHDGAVVSGLDPPPFSPSSPRTHPSAACSSGSVDKTLPLKHTGIHQGLDPMTWTYALFFLHVVVQEKPPSLIAPSSITENILCFVQKTTLKTFRQVHRGCTVRLVRDCMK